jgi:hypothetical protein
VSVMSELGLPNLGYYLSLGIVVTIGRYSRAH